MIVEGKLKSGLSKLKRWDFQRFEGSIKGAIARKEADIKNFEVVNDIISVPEWIKANKELDALLEEDEVYWKQRSREDWLMHEDKNSK